MPHFDLAMHMHTQVYWPHIAIIVTSRFTAALMTRTSGQNVGKLSNDYQIVIAKKLCFLYYSCN